MRITIRPFGLPLYQIEWVAGGVIVTCERQIETRRYLMDLTWNEKVSRVVRWLTEGHLSSEGGYPYDSMTHNGLVFVARFDEEHAATRIYSYVEEDLAEWYDRAEGYIAEHEGLSLRWPEDGYEFGDWSEAFYETED